LHDPIGGRRDPEAPHLARRFGDRFLLHPLRDGFSQDLLLQLQLRHPTPQPGQLGAFLPAQHGRPVLAFAAQLLDQVTQCPVVDPDLPGHLPDRPTL
jgi:hypothetical protein